MKRTAAHVQADIDATTDTLLLADLVQDWPTGDAALDQLKKLWDEYALIPHPRLPADSDGHRSPGRSY